MAEESDKIAAHLWYTRKAGEVKGPFPARSISCFLLLGRMTQDDEVSQDRKHWRVLRELPEMIPDEVRDADTEEGYQRLLAARMREDERLRERRCDDRQVAHPRRRGSDRRAPEPAAMVRHREVRQELLQSAAGRPNYLVPGIITALGLIVLFAAGVFVYRALPAHTASATVCGGSPAPGVSWSNCGLEGLQAAGADLTGAHLDNADLRGADLHGAMLAESDLAYSNVSTADLRYANLANARLLGTGLRNSDLSYAHFNGADLSYADLRGARITGAVWDGAKLDKAIWIDGRVCAAGSVGRCVEAAR
ncbi:MAG: pentapeptide repeat-containing protein [Gammaproteobacteria bacterium]